MDTRNTDVKKILEPLTSIEWTQETLTSKTIGTIDFHRKDTRNTDVKRNIRTIDFHYMDTRNTDVKKILEPLTSIVWTQETLMSKKH